MNVGSGYDTTTGKFKAPTDGTYLFTCQLCQHASDDIHFGMVMDDTVIHQGYFGSGKTICTSFNVITEMRQSQMVWMKMLNTDKIYQDLWRLNVFSGVLIH